MLFKSSLKKGNNKDLIVLIIRIHLLVFCLIAVLWSRQKIKKKLSPNNSVQVLERKARFLPPSLEENKSSEDLKNDKDEL